MKMSNLLNLKGSKKDQRRQEYLEKNPMAAIMEDVTRGWETFHSVIRCDKETKKICKIAIPGTIEAGFGTVMSAVLVAIISRYLGEDALMATAMVDLALVGTSILGSGIGGAEEVMVSQLSPAESSASVAPSCSNTQSVKITVVPGLS